MYRYEEIHEYLRVITEQNTASAPSAPCNAAESEQDTWDNLTINHNRQIGKSLVRNTPAETGLSQARGLREME